MSDSRRAELAEFLRARRARVTPESVGLPRTARRRTPGLRREEVAELAQISVPLYAWLEQGRAVPVSSRTLDAIATALGLSIDERGMLMRLARPESVELDERIMPSTERLVFTFANPAYLVDHLWNVRLRNRAAIVVLGGPPDRREPFNLLRQFFFDEGLRAFVPGRDDVLRAVVELFRYDYALFSSEPDTIALVESMRAKSPEFEALWKTYAVRSSAATARTVVHPIAGRIAIEPSTYAVIGSPGLRIVLYTPVDAESARRIDELLRSDAAAGTDSKFQLP